MKAAALDEELVEVKAATLEIRREDPWTSIIPMNTLVREHYETLAASTRIQPYRLLTVGTHILNYVKEGQGKSYILDP